RIPFGSDKVSQELDPFALYRSHPHRTLERAHRHRAFGHRRTLLRTAEQGSIAPERSIACVLRRVQRQRGTASVVGGRGACWLGSSPPPHGEDDDTGR